MRWCRVVGVGLVWAVGLGGCRSGFDRSHTAGPGATSGFTVTERAETGPVTSIAARPPYVWAAGALGLRRFDLKSAEMEIVGEGGDAHGGPVVAIALDEEGGAWVASAKELGRWAPAGDELRYQPKGFPGEVTVLAAGRPVRSEGVWVGGSRGLARFDEGRGLLAVEALRGVAITSLDIDADGRSVWVGTRGHGLYRVTGEQAEQVTGGIAIELDDIVGTVKTAAGTRIVAGNTAGEGRFYALTLAGVEGYRAGPGQHVLALVERGGDAVLIAGPPGGEQAYRFKALGPTEGVPHGALRFSSLVRERPTRFTALPLELRLPPQPTVAAGGGDDLYVGSARMGVVRAAPGRAEGLEGSELVQDATRLYVGCVARAQCFVVTDGGRAFRTDGDRYQPASVGEPAGASVLALATDASDGAVLAVSAGGQPAGLVITKHAADPNAAWQTLHRIALELPPRTTPGVSFAALSPAGALWLGLRAWSGGEDVGLGALEIDLSNGRVVEHGPQRPNVHLVAESLPLPAKLTGILFDGGVTWTASLAGVSRFSEGQLRTWNENDGFVSESVHALSRGPDGAVWAASSNGLVRFDGKQWRALGAAEISARGLVVDHKRRVWVATQKGLRVMEPGASDPDAGAVVIAARMRDVTVDGFGRVWAMSSATIALVDEK